MKGFPASRSQALVLLGLLALAPACERQPPPPPPAPAPPKVLAPWSWHKLGGLVVIEGEVDVPVDLVLKGHYLNERTHAEFGPVRWEIYAPPAAEVAELRTQDGKLLARWAFSGEASPEPAPAPPSAPPPAPIAALPEAPRPAPPKPPPPQPVAPKPVAPAPPPKPWPETHLPRVDGMHAKAGRTVALPAPKPLPSPAPPAKPAPAPAPPVAKIAPAPKPLPSPAPPAKPAPAPLPPVAKVAPVPKPQPSPAKPAPAPAPLVAKAVPPPPPAPRVPPPPEARPTPLPEPRPVLPPGLPPSQEWPGAGEALNLIRGPRGNHWVCMTFDGGSTAEVATDVLDALKERNIHTTLFLTGAFIQKYPDIVRRIDREGHEIGNHTMDHPHFAPRMVRDPKWTKERFQQQLLMADVLLLKLLGHPMAPYWRAPYGEQTPELRKWAEELGYRHVGWSEGADTLDWATVKERKLYRTGNAILDRLHDRMEKQDGDGLIVLMHLGSGRPESDRPARVLGPFLDKALDEGWVFVNISDYLKESGKPRWNSANRLAMLGQAAPRQ